MINIIEKFNENEERFAKEAVIEAKKRKGEINDILLKEVNDCLTNIKTNKDYYCPISVFYSIYLLAEFEEKKLFPILVEIFKQKGNTEDIMDPIIDRLPSIIASVFDGNFKLLNSIIENKKISKWVRDGFLTSYIYFYDNNLISEKDLKEYLLKLIKLFNYADDFIYNSILNVIINTHQFSLIKDVKLMFYHGVIDNNIRGGYDSFIDGIFNYDDSHNIDKFTKIEDTINEMSSWYCFNKNKDEINNFNQDEFKEGLKTFIKKEIETNTFTKVGRNDPCPCGSGKKYKKCCLNKQQSELPYQSYIDKSINEYPKRKEKEEQFDLYDFYKEEYIEVDYLLYKVLKRKPIPIFINRDYNKENKIDLAICQEAFEKIKLIESKNKFKTIDEYDEYISIHYSLYGFFDKFSRILIDSIKSQYCTQKKELLIQLEDLINFFYNNFNLKNHNESIFLDRIKSIYILKGKLKEGIDFFIQKLDDCHKCIKYDVYDCLFDILLCEDEDNIKIIEDLIEKESDLELKESLEDLKDNYVDWL